MIELLMSWLPYLALGCVTGLLAGLLGVGGGLIIVPALALLFQHFGIGADKLMHLALSAYSILDHQVSCIFNGGIWGRRDDFWRH